ncbi:WRKY transcription factor 44 isoform X2 [Mercurialis annua]|uniref:WRKY transcription factor 44 isoform X2 n=1 Tax=Mercurialis annua TaxID=3986 RepID=UPI0024AD5277|nr:WRKY transcription factor 44 isoform X2 [Mercurialis annua]
MEINEAGRVVIAKPVASRPSCSNLRSVSELLAGVNGSPSNMCSGTTFAAIRPKTVRFKQMVNRDPAASISSLVKLVSKTTVSLLANMGNFNDIHKQKRPPSLEARVQNPTQDKRHFSLDFLQNIPSHAQTDQTIESSSLSSHNQEDDPKSLYAASSGDRPSYDGYNWRKYGQKQVKGSESPRSYYKCTHPNCPVKKKVERSLDGQIAEIVYKGEHNHSKPQPPKRNSSGTQGRLGIASDGHGQQYMSNPLWYNPLSERNEGSESRVENQNEIESNYQSGAFSCYDHAGTGVINAGAIISNNSCGLNEECDEGSKRLEGGEGEPKSKRRKSDNQPNEAGISGVRSATETEIIGDGFRWRKYGQKVVKGNLFPRSYYRCTGLKCNVRKYVERVSDDPGAFITTYEGKHEHEMPLRSSNSASSGGRKSRET